MSIPFDQKLAKLRILERRAKEEAERAQKEFERIKDEAWKPVGVANERYVSAGSAYLARARELGYCGVCEKPVIECQCVWQANADIEAIKGLRAGLAAADALAHQYIFTPFHARYWQARGGHDACTVCEPAEAAICACGEPKDPKADSCLNCYALHDSEEATSDRPE